MLFENLYSDGQTELDIDGLRVDVYVDQQNDRLSLRNAEPGSDDYGTVVGHATFALIENPTFVVNDPGNQPHALVRGRVSGLDEDGEVEWNTLVRMANNDVCDAVYPDEPADMDGFQVRNVARMNWHDYEPGDVIRSGLFAGVVATPDETGVSIMLAGGDADDIPTEA